MLVLRFNDSEDIYHVEFAQSSTNVVSILSQEDLPKTAPGFKLYSNEAPESILGDYSAYNTLYRYIDSKQAQYSNDGSQYVQPVKDVVVKAVWDDEDDMMKIRPTSILVDVYTNGKKTGTDELKPNKNPVKNWTVTHHNKPLENVYTINAPDLPRYEKSVSGTQVNYKLTIPQPRTFSLDDVAEVALDSENARRLLIYASFCERNEKNFHAVPEELQPQVQTIINADGFTILEDGTCIVTPFNVEGGE